MRRAGSALHEERYVDSECAQHMARGARFSRARHALPEAVATAAHRHAARTVL